MGAARWCVWAALQHVLVRGQLPLLYRTDFGAGPERSCPIPKRAGEHAFAQSRPGIPGYLDSCKQYDIQPSADVLNQLNVGLQNISVRSIGDLDLRALVMLLLDQDGFYLSRIRSLDFSWAHLDASGMLIIAQLLMHPSCVLEELDLSFQSVGLQGACAVGSAVRVSRTMQALRMHTCSLFDEGGQVMLDLIRNTSLRTVDLQNNIIEYVTCQAILAVAGEVAIDVDLDGNQVFDEVINAVTHGIGVVLGIAGMVLLLNKVKNKPSHYKCSIAIYSTSATMLYLFSTLYHSFFSLGRTTVEIFRTLDYCGIFLLIAGTYTPMFVILFHGELWAKLLIRGMWISALLGISIAAFYRGPGETVLRLTMFLGMGWTAIFALRQILKELGREGAIWLIVGGVLYTVGVPFFVRGGHIWEVPDHATWHLFVLSASTCHFFCIYWYVASRPVVRDSEKGMDVPLTERTRSSESESSDDESTLKAALKDTGSP